MIASEPKLCAIAVSTAGECKQLRLVSLPGCSLATLFGFIWLKQRRQLLPDLVAVQEDAWVLYWVVASEQLSIPLLAVLD